MRIAFSYRLRHLPSPLTLSFPETCPAPGLPNIWTNCRPGRMTPPQQLPRLPPHLRPSCAYMGDIFTTRKQPEGAMGVVEGLYLVVAVSSGSCIRGELRRYEWMWNS